MKFCFLLSLFLLSLSSVMAQKLVSILYWSESIEGQLSMRRGLENELKKVLKNQQWKIASYVAGDGNDGVKKYKFPLYFG